MAGRDEESQKVMSAAMRCAKSGDRSELKTFSLAVLQKADYQLSDRDNGSGYRRAISDQIAELQSRIDNRSTTKHINVVDIKPSIYGVSINVNEVWRRVRQWLTSTKK